MLLPASEIFGKEISSVSASELKCGVKVVLAHSLQTFLRVETELYLTRHSS